MKIRNQIPKTEDQIKQDFFEELECHTYTQNEVRRYAGSIKFFVTQSRVKIAYNRALKELDKTLRYTYTRKI